MYILTGRFYKLCLILFLLLLSLLAGCGGGNSGGGNGSSLITASPSDDALLTLTSDTAVNVASFNGKSMYVLITAEPNDKPESDDSVETYSFALSSTTGTSTGQATLSLVESSTATGSTSGTNTAFDSAAQKAYDQMCRKKENSLLASKAKQFSKSSSSLLKSTAPTGNIKKGDPWKEVWVIGVAQDEFVPIDTTCCYVSDNTCIFVDDRDVSSLSSYVEDYGEAFDQIYQVNHQHFGTENDTDDNDKVIVVFSEELTGGLLGYFNGSDKFAYNENSNPYSNQGDIIYITTDANYQKYVKGTMAHEFQHMIYFDEHYNNGVINTYTWLNEALSQAAEYYNNETELQEARLKYFLAKEQGGLSLTYWTSYSYGYGAIFIRYLIDQYGDTAIKKMCSNKYVGIKAVEQATGVDFNTIFTNFARTLVLSDYSQTSSSLYKFTTLTLADYGGLASLSTLNAGSSLSGDGSNNSGGDAIYPYSINFYQCSGTFGTMTLSGSCIIGTVFGLAQD
jgi:hypothetical protein